jgi:hypothetical protein
LLVIYYSNLKQLSNVTDADFGEVRYFFRLRFGEEVHALAVISLFSLGDASLLKQSYQTVYSCKYEGDTKLIACNVKAIKAVVAMVPFFKVTPDAKIVTPENQYFLVQKPYLEITTLRGEVEQNQDMEL